jgi:4-hydroxyphenylpyruvate dioxygenase
MSSAAQLAERPISTVLLGWDHLELWVGNARAYTAFLSSAFGFDVVAYAGPETGWSREQVSYVLEQGDLRLLVTSSLVPDSEVAEHVKLHGDGVRDVAFLVEDAELALEAAVAKGATVHHKPHRLEDEHGKLTFASINAYGDTKHSFVERRAYSGVFAPGYRTEGIPLRPVGPRVGLHKIDHVVANVELGKLEEWVGYYQRIFGMDQLVHFDDAQISTEYSALMSTVVWDGSKVVLPINEPAEGRKKSQIQEYLEAYRGPGVQHIAMRTDDIVSTVAALRERGVRFLSVPPSYYDDAKERLAGVDLPWEDLARLGILVDRDQDGHLLQIFTEVLGDRPTLFLEVIQREGAKGFGAGNFKALFESIEREQARRGNL